MSMPNADDWKSPRLLVLLSGRDALRSNILETSIAKLCEKQLKSSWLTIPADFHFDFEHKAYPNVYAYRHDREFDHRDNGHSVPDAAQVLSASSYAFQPAVAYCNNREIRQTAECVVGPGLVRTWEWLVRCGGSVGSCTSRPGLRFLASRWLSMATSSS